VPREAASSPVHLAKCSVIISDNNRPNKKNTRRYIRKYSIRIIILYVWQHYVQVEKVERWNWNSRQASTSLRATALGVAVRVDESSFFSITLDSNSSCVCLKGRLEDSNFHIIHLLIFYILLANSKSNTRRRFRTLAVKDPQQLAL